MNEMRIEIMSRRRLEPDLNTIAKRLKTLENKVNVADTSESEDWPVEFLDSSEDDGVADDPILEQNEEVKEEIVKIEDDTFNIPDEIRVLLGDVQDPSKNLGKKIIQELSSKVEMVLKEGLKKEERETITNRNNAPENCQFLGAPKLNAEIAATLNYRQIQGDKKMASRQNKIGTALTAILQVTDNIIKQGDKENVVPLIDAINLLADSQHYDTKMRKSAIIPLLDKKLLNFLNDTPNTLDGHLFGKDLGNKIRQYKSVGRQGANIKAKNFISNQANISQSQRPKPEGGQYNVSGTNNPNNYRKNNQTKKFRGKFNTDKTQFQSKMNNVQRTAAYKK
ncbi:hypothetical protein MSG28_005812 [Choristoneura fumiferana]|uniref:Uncharacterized protein n=1 Tax=Choristoneura fumiferana TaxID=7141 RepID=A0ACC0L1H8_CHOFU|nr:hypothetical protein MSG28_005812 [Choristoneura fumiferana]